MLFERLKVYGLGLSFIVTWWTFAFFDTSCMSQDISISLENSIEDISKKTIPDHTTIHIDRDLLMKALAGNSSLMMQLIADWDIDAQLLQVNGFKEIQRLPQNDFLKVHLLARHIKDKKVSLDQHLRFLPQTYSAASFLLALLPASQIVALPNSLREQTELYPKEITDNIPLDINRYNSEKLFQEAPKIAFAAQYSDPATLQALKDQGIQLYLTKDFNTLEDISEELLNIGQLIDRTHEAELMQLFLTAATIALDNQLLLLKQHFSIIDKPLPRVLYLNYHQNFSIPTSKTLTAYFLQKIEDWDMTLKYGEDRGLKDIWTVPIDKEHLLNLNPDCLIIATEHPLVVKESIINDNALQNIKAVRNRHLYFIKESIQQSPSQYIILAYFDLVDSLLRVR